MVGCLSGHATATDYSLFTRIVGDGAYDGQHPAALSVWRRGWQGWSQAAQCIFGTAVGRIYENMINTLIKAVISDIDA